MPVGSCLCMCVQVCVNIYVCVHKYILHVFLCLYVLVCRVLWAHMYAPKHMRMCEQARDVPSAELLLALDNQAVILKPKPKVITLMAVPRMFHSPLQTCVQK